MYLPLITAPLLVSTYGLSVGVISDMHTNLLYDSTIDASDDCWSSGNTKAETPSAWGRFGCDPSQELVDAML